MRTTCRRYALSLPAILAHVVGCSEAKAPALDPLVMSPSAATLRVGEAVQFSAGVARGVVWHTSDPTRVSVNDAGLATAVAAGAATVSAVRGDERVSGIVTVSGCSLLGPTVSPPNANIVVGDSVLVRVRTDFCGPPPIDTRVTWTSSNSAVATAESRPPIDGWQTGMVRAHSIGQAAITAAFVVEPSVTASSAVTVRAP